MINFLHHVVEDMKTVKPRRLLNNSDGQVRSYNSSREGMEITGLCPSYATLYC